MSFKLFSSFSGGKPFRPRGIFSRQKSKQDSVLSPERVFIPRTASFVGAAGSADWIPDFKGLPEVIVAGRANCGKSSLLNAVLGRKDLVNTSKKPGATRTLKFFQIGDDEGKVVLVDAPGYGARGRPEWGKLFDTYLETREHLHRIYILFNGKHPLNSYDTAMLGHLSDWLVKRRAKIPLTLQAVITKADAIPGEEVDRTITRLRKDIAEVAPLCLPPIITSVGMSPPFGIQELRQNILDSCWLGAVAGPSKATKNTSKRP